MTQDPFKDSRQAVSRQRAEFAMGLARVVDVPDGSAHEVTIRPITNTGAPQTDAAEDTVPVLVAQKGDVALPRPDDIVVFDKLQNGGRVVVGVVYSKESSIRDYAADERHIGADDSGGAFIHGPFVAAPSVSADPTDPPDGAVWYRTDLDEYRGAENGSTVSFDTTPI